MRVGFGEHRFGLDDSHPHVIRVHGCGSKGGERESRKRLTQDVMIQLERRPRVVFFDAGGVLLELPNASRVVTSALQSLGYAVPNNEVLRMALEASWAEMEKAGPIDLLWPPQEEDDRALAGATVLGNVLGLPSHRAWYLRDTCYLMHNLRVYQDAPIALHQLAAAGYAIGLISNAPPSLRSKLHLFGLSRFLDPTVISSEVGSAKPNPEIYRVALRRWGGNASDALFVDDLPVNVAGARAVGMSALHLDRSRQAGNLHDLLELVRELTGNPSPTPGCNPEREAEGRALPQAPE